MQHVGAASGLGGADLQCAGKRQTQEILVERPRLFRVATAVGVVVQSLDHGYLGLRKIAQSINLSALTRWVCASRCRSVTLP